MRRSVLTAMWTALAACGSGTSAPATETVPVVHEVGLQGFPAKLDTLRVQLRIPGMSAAIAQQGRVVWSMGFGEAVAETRVEATPQTPFHLASLTKPFASTILMQLVEEGLLDLDDFVDQYGVDLPNASHIRVRHLLTHTSEGVPGEAYRYNGNRFGYLGQVIASASGRAFGLLLQERILAPLGLDDTAPNPLQPDVFSLTGMNRASFMARMAAGYELRSGQVFPMEHPTYFGVSAGLVSSAEDVAAFSLAIDEGRFLGAETWTEVFTPAVSTSTGETLAYALGWFIQEYQGITLQWHYGHWTTNSSLIVRVPDRELTFVVLANTNNLSRAYGLGVDNNVLRSDVARLFVESFVLGDEPLPTGKEP